jgi:hypothetical protein
VNLAAQQATPKDVNKLTLEEIIEFMKEQYDPKLYLVRECNELQRVVMKVLVDLRLF